MIISGVPVYYNSKSTSLPNEKVLDPLHDNLEILSFASKLTF